LTRRQPYTAGEESKISNASNSYNKSNSSDNEVTDFSESSGYHLCGERNKTWRERSSVVNFTFISAVYRPEQNTINSSTQYRINANKFEYNIGILPSLA